MRHHKISDELQHNNNNNDNNNSSRGKCDGEKKGNENKKIFPPPSCRPPCIHAKQENKNIFTYSIIPICLLANATFCPYCSYLLPDAVAFVSFFYFTILLPPSSPFLFLNTAPFEIECDFSNGDSHSHHLCQKTHTHTHTYLFIHLFTYLNIHINVYLYNHKIIHHQTNN